MMYACIPVTEKLCICSNVINFFVCAWPTHTGVAGEVFNNLQLQVFLHITHTHTHTGMQGERFGVSLDKEKKGMKGQTRQRELKEDTGPQGTHFIAPTCTDRCSMYTV